MYHKKLYPKFISVDVNISGRGGYSFLFEAGPAHPHAKWNWASAFKLSSSITKWANFSEHPSKHLGHPNKATMFRLEHFTSHTSMRNEVIRNSAH